MSTDTFPRKNALAKRHHELGSKLDTEWNGRLIPQHYDTDPYEEVAIVRSKAGLSMCRPSGSLMCRVPTSSMC